MPLLKKKPFKRLQPPAGLELDDEVFYCEATKEVFKDYESFFQRTILCNSLVWSCSVTGKGNLTYEEAVESEQKAKKRLGDIPKPLKKALLWLADRTRRGKLSDVVDDVYAFAGNRFFLGEVVEGIMNEMWCDCKVMKVIPPTQEEIDKDAAEEQEEESKKAKDDKESPTKNKKAKKSFSPPEHLFKYELLEVEPDNPDNNPVRIVDADDIRREKGIYTREKNLLFLKNVIELSSDGNHHLLKQVEDKYKLKEMLFSEIFAGPEPVFEESLRKKAGKKAQGTLDGWVTGKKSGSEKASKDKSAGPKENKPKMKKQTAAEIEAEMKRMKEQNERFKQEMKQRAEEARKKKIEEKAKEKERQKEQKKIVAELLAEWKRPRDDLECDDLKELPKTLPVHCRIPNKLFGDFLTLLEFFHSFSNILECEDTFSDGITFELLEKALTDTDTPRGALFELLKFMLQALFDLQQEEDEEVKLDVKNLANVNIGDLDKNMLGKDEEVANQIRSATQWCRWCIKHQGQPIKALHLDEFTITEILRLHIESSGAYRSDKSLLWLYQQKGGYRLSDDPGLQFRMEEPRIVEALKTKTIFELSIPDKIKVLICLMQQMLSYAAVRDEVDDRFIELSDAKYELRQHRIDENKRIKQMEEAEKLKRKEERMAQKEAELKEKESLNNQKEEELKDKENQSKDTTGKKVEPAATKKVDPVETTVHLTDRQREAIQSQKEKEEKEKQRKEDIKRSEAFVKEKELTEKIIELQMKAGPVCLGRDRAYRRYWVLEAVPGLFVEHDDDLVGTCLASPTKINPDSKPMDENTAVEMAKRILDAREKPAAEANASNNQGSDKENDHEETNAVKKEIPKTYSKTNAVQKVLSTKNGTLQMSTTSSTNDSSASTSEVQIIDKDSTAGEVVVKKETLVNGNAVEHIQIKPDPEIVMKTEKSVDMFGVCLADTPDNCTVHSTILPKTHWSYVSTVDEVDQIIEALNPRGFRESDLKEKLLYERDSIIKNMKKFDSDLESKLQINSNDEDIKIEEKNHTVSQNQDINAIVDLAIRDQILELEERIFFGTLGSLKIRDRLAWQSAIQNGSYDMQCEGLTWGGKSSINTPFESRMVSEAASRDNSRPGTPDSTTGNNHRDSGNSFVKHQNEKVRGLASAILQVSQMAEAKYFKQPLGEDEKEKKKRLKEEEKRKKEAEDDTVQSQDPPKEILTPLQEWEVSLMNSTSYAQLFVHLTTLDSSIIWSKSIMNAKCRICRRKGDPEQMLLCDGCDRGHHMYCLKPKMKKIPTGDWYCNECKPKERVKTPKKKARQVFKEEDEEDENDEDEDEQDEEEAGNSSDEADSDAEDQNKEITPPRRTKKAKRSVDPPKKQKKAPAKKNLSHLLGKRKSATAASERISRVTQEETGSGHSSGSEAGEPAAKVSPEAPVVIPGERQSTRLRDRKDHPSTTSITGIAESAKNLKEQRNSLESQNASNARNKRRRAVDEELLAMYNPSALEDLLNNMMKHKDGWPFDRPITRADAPDYFNIIQKPIDLGTIRSNLLRMKYSCNSEVLQDIKTVFENCFTYNREDAEEFQCAIRLDKYFTKEAKKLGLVDEDEDEIPLAKRSRRTF